MALRYRNEYVLSSLRAAYSLKHSDDSLLLNEAHEVMAKQSRNLSDIEADIANLSLRLRSDSTDTKTVYSRSSSVNSDRNTIGDDGSGSDDEERPDTPTIDGNVRRSNQTSPLKPQPYQEFNEFSLDIEDDSDFEDNLLQATQDIKYNVQMAPSSEKSESSQHRPHRALNAARSTKRSSLDSSDPVELFAKRELPGESDVQTNNAATSGAPFSRLTSKLTTTHKDPREQYMEAVAGLQTSGIVGVTLKMHISGHAGPVDITVKQDCTTHLAIGYALLKAGIEPGDANLYNLRIVEDDGEPDEDFPALERTRPVASYHVDEFAIVKATESEFKENAKRTPNKVSFKSSSSSASSAGTSTSISMPSNNGAEPFPHLPGSTNGNGAPHVAVDTAGQQYLSLPQQGKSTNFASSGTSALATTKSYQYPVNQHPQAQAQAQAKTQAQLLAQAQGQAQHLFSQDKLLIANAQRRASASARLTTGQQHDGSKFAPPRTRSLSLQHGDSSANGRGHQRDVSASKYGPVVFNSSYSSSLSGTKMETVAVKIYMHPYDPILSQVFWADEMVPKQSFLKDVFDHMCREKMMDSEMYVLRKTTPPHPIINMTVPINNLLPTPTPTETVSSLTKGTLAGAGVAGAPANAPLNSTGHGNQPLSVSFELIARRNLPPSQQAQRPRSSSRAMLNSDSQQMNANKAKKKPPSDILQNSVLAMQPLGFYKYPVLRRQQMNILGRGERELVIDGEYIHIMPPTDWSLMDQPKTTTFHIRQVLRVKQSRKISTNFSIMVMKAAGPKRYDLESTDTATTVEIVDRLQRLKSARSKIMS